MAEETVMPPRTRRLVLWLSTPVVVFAIAGLFGFGAMIPLYQQGGSPTYYALLGTVGALQIMFLLIAWKPAELRPAMVPAVLEKLFWCTTWFVLYSRGSLS